MFVARSMSYIAMGLLHAIWASEYRLMMSHHEAKLWWLTDWCRQRRLLLLLLLRLPSEIYRKCRQLLGWVLGEWGEGTALDDWLASLCLSARDRKIALKWRILFENGALNGNCFLRVINVKAPWSHVHIGWSLLVNNRKGWMSST